MKELLSILSQANHLSQKNQRYAIATVVKIGGSTYRRPGARMLITEEGEHWGTISGGCLEGEVAQQALQVIETQQARLLPFNLEEDDIVLGFGTGCNGIVHVLIQPIPPDTSQSCVDALVHCIHHRQRGVMATIISHVQSEETQTEGSSCIGQHVVLLEDQSPGPSTYETETNGPVLSTCTSILEKRTSSRTNLSVAYPAVHAWARDHRSPLRNRKASYTSLYFWRRATMYTQ